MDTCLNHSWWYKHNQLKGVMKNQDIKGSFLKILENIFL